MKKILSFVLSSLVVPALLASIGLSCGKHEPGPRACTTPVIPSYASLPSNPKLPDPFKFLDGSRVNSKKEWECRRVELAALAQQFEYGYKPKTPYSATTASFDGKNILTVNVSDSGKTITFNCSITYPNTGSKPYPAVIGVGASNLDNEALSNLGVAIINLPQNTIALQNNASSRGKGLFYDMFGSGHTASATMAWAWAASRLIDAIEKTPVAGIDPKRLGVTGCSRNGKGALVVGAFDERIKLTIPQEPGAGGAASWRISDAQLAAGKNVQTLGQIVNENVWFTSSFAQFSKTADKLPYDQHSIMGLVAPRALLVVENTGIDWLSPVSSWNSANAAYKIWQALGVPDRMGFSQVSHGSTHCRLPASQLPELTAYVGKFLVGGGTDNTTVMKTDGGFAYDEAAWVDWSVPSLK